MPSPDADRIHDLTDFYDLLAALAAEGHGAVVIGGCAVAAYAHLLGESLFSVDLDLYADRETLDAIVRWAGAHGAVVHKRPQAGSVPVAFIEWEGKEVNVLTAVLAFPQPDTALRSARVFRPRERKDLAILVADPFDLLANKLAVDRPKDRAHIEVLRRFIAEEVVQAFKERTDARERLDPARRLLKVIRSRVLPGDLAARLVPLARTPADMRFLAAHVPARSMAEDVQSRAETIPDVAVEVAEIISHRRFRSRH